MGSELAQPAYIEGGLANTNAGSTDTEPEFGLGEPVEFPEESYDVMDLLGTTVIEETDT